MGEEFDFKELGALNLCSFMYQATNAAFPSANTFGFHYSTQSDGNKKYPSRINFREILLDGNGV